MELSNAVKIFWKHIDKVSIVTIILLLHSRHTNTRTMFYCLYYHSKSLCATGLARDTTSYKTTVNNVFDTMPIFSKSL